MKNRVIKMFLYLIFFLGILPVGNAENLPNKIFRLGEIEIAKTPLDEIKKNYGGTEQFRISKNDGSDEFICYVQKLGKLKQYVVFETGEMGGYKQLTGFRISAKKPQNVCIPVSSEMPKATANGVSIGETYAEFIRRFPFRFMSYKKIELTLKAFFF